MLGLGPQWSCTPDISRPGLGETRNTLGLRLSQKPYLGVRGHVSTRGQLLSVFQEITVEKKKRNTKQLHTTRARNITITSIILRGVIVMPIYQNTQDKKTNTTKYTELELRKNSQHFLHEM